MKSGKITLANKDLLQTKISSTPEGKGELMENYPCKRRSLQLQNVNMKSGKLPLQTKISSTPECKCEIVENYPCKRRSLQLQNVNINSVKITLAIEDLRTPDQSRQNSRK